MLRPFPFAGDGHTVEHLVAGEDREFGDCTEGLIAEGFISVGAKSAHENPVVVTEDTSEVAVTNDASEDSETGEDDASVSEEEQPIDLLSADTIPRRGRKRK